MKKKLIALVFALLLPVLALTGCGCEHEWVDATCTEPKTCSKCGETEGKPVGHTEGKWETVETDLVNASVTEKKYCTECSIELAEETTALEKLYDAGLFLFSPEQFAERMSKMVSEQGDSNLSLETRSAENLFFCVILSDGEYAGNISFSTAETALFFDNMITIDKKDIPCFNQLLAGAYGSENAVGVLTALIQTVDPTFAYSEAYDLSCAMIDTPDEITKNGITYETDTRDGVLFMIHISIDS